MKRPKVKLTTITTNGEETYEIFNTMKEAEAKARDIALTYLRTTGINTQYHDRQVYKFDDGFTIKCNKIRESIS